MSLIQFTLTAVVVGVGAACGGMMAPSVVTSEAFAPDRFDLSWQDRVRDWLAIALAVMLILLPIGLIVLNGINFGLPRLLLRPQFWDALMTSTHVAVISAVIVTALALVMAAAKADLSLPHRWGRMAGARYLRVMMDQGVMLYLVIPSVVLGTAAFILLRARGDVFGYAFGVVILANTLMALPFAYRLLDARMTSLMARHDRLAAQLGIRGMVRWRVLTLPALRQDLGLVAGLSAALSFGDLGVIALFANADFRTLPWLLYQLSGKYAADEAHALAMLVMLLTLGLFLTARFATDRALRGVMLEVKNVTFAYAGTPLAEFAFNLTVARSEIVVVSGRSGAGKSTLLNLIAGFLTPDQGRIIWQGQDLAGTAPADRPLSMIFQDDNLFDHLTCRLNVALGLRPSLSLSKAEWQAVDAAMDELGILAVQQRCRGAFQAVSNNVWPWPGR